MDSIIMVGVGCFKIGCMAGGLAVILAAKISNARDRRKARMFRDQRKTVWNIDVPGVG